MYSTKQNIDLLIYIDIEECAYKKVSHTCMSYLDVNDVTNARQSE